jgi:Sap, sulfolipid-1-addressing protein
VTALILQVLPLAIGAAVTPTLFALQVLVVSGPHSHKRALAVIAGSAGVFGVYFALILGGLSQLPDAGTGTSSRTEHVIQLVAGLVLAGLAVWLLLPHPQTDARLEQRVTGYADHASATVFAGLAASMSLTDFSTLVLLVPALHAVTLSAEPVAGKALVTALLMACVLLPVTAPALLVRFGGDRALRLLRRAYTLVMGYQLQVMGAVAAVIATALVYRGARGLM